LTQNQKIMQHLRKYGSITTMEAFMRFGITRLPSRIHELRKAGNTISGTTVYDKNRFWDNVHYTRYTLNKAV